MKILRKLRSLLRREANQEDQPILAVVLLLREPITLTEEDLHGAILSAWGFDIGLTDEDSKEKGLLVVGMPTSVITREGQLFLVHSVARHYTEDPEQIAAGMKDLRLRQIILEHKAWLSVDVIRSDAPPEAERVGLYRLMCWLAREFLSNNCLGVYLPETALLKASDEYLVEAMGSDDPLRAISQLADVPVVQAEDEELMDAAVDEARRRLPEFVRAFHSRTPDQFFSVKAPFEDEKHGEWMWVRVLSIAGNTFTGELGNAPVYLKNVREGDIVTVKADEIGDWLYILNEREKVGGFSIPVVLKSKPRDKT
jgi:uncharacterized protein YegJ (DUF2314 family)